MNVADRIQNLRRAKGISQEELADKIGVSRQSVSKWESEQSIPDIDKVIVMSEYFEVTTDYILKGIENGPQPAEKTVNANIFVMVGTAFNFMGLIVGCAVWHEEQSPMALAIAGIFMALGCMVFGIGFYSSTPSTRAPAKRNFWAANIWLLAFIPFSLIYNALFTGFGAPYPILPGAWNWVALLCFGLGYIALSLVITLMQLKVLGKNK